MTQPRLIHPIDLCIGGILDQPELTIIQLGAHVGNTRNDPLYRHVIQAGIGWRAGGAPDAKIILVEPVRKHFEALRGNYTSVPGVICENVAVSDHTGTAEFFHLGVDPVTHGFPAYLSQMGSLKEDRMGGLWDGYDKNPEFKAFCLKHRVIETVSCVTFAALIARHSVHSVDLLQIDVEGFEYEILSSIDFDTVRPRFINYESVLLNDRKPACEQLLRSQGYMLLDHHQDTFCFRPEDQALFATLPR